MAKKNILCPFCFKNFNNTDAEYQCTNYETNSNREPFCPLEVDKKYNDFWKNQSETKHFFRNKSLKVSLFGSTPGPAKCDKCGAESRRFVCPHCHNIIPSEMIEVGSEIISVIGAPDSGKTVYFTALMREMRSRGSSWCNITVNPVTESLCPGEKSTAETFDEYTRTLFDQHQKLKKTIYKKNERCIPLIFSLRTKKGYNDKNGKIIYLVFYDTSGEAFKNKDNIDNIKYLKESSGVIILLDPYSVPALSSTLGQPTSEQKVEKIVEQLTGACSTEDLKDKPIALVFSKVDAVINGLKKVQANYMIPGVDLTKNSSFLATNKFSLDEINQIDGAISTVCQKEWKIEDLKSKLAQSYSAVKEGRLDDNVKYFAVSSLGRDINDKSEFESFRVMDPLIWILHRIGGFNIPVE